MNLLCSHTCAKGRKISIGMCDFTLGEIQGLTLCTGMLCVRIALGKNYSNWINAFGKGVTCHVVMVVTAIKMHQATLSIAALKLKRIYRHELAAS